VKRDGMAKIFRKNCLTARKAFPISPRTDGAAALSGQLTNRFSG